MSTGSGAVGRYRIYAKAHWPSNLCSGAAESAVIVRAPCPSQFVVCQESKSDKHSILSGDDVVVTGDGIPKN